MNRLKELSFEVEKETTCLTGVVDKFEISLKDDLEKFSTLATDGERLKFLDIHNFASLIDIKEGFERKDKVLSEQYRGDGNGSFKAKKFNDALQKYNLAVRYAPFDGDVLTMALGNRSAVFFRMKMYDECIKDIERALSMGYPKALSYKLHYRKYKCFYMKKSFEKSVDCLKEFKESLKDASIDRKERDSYEKSYENDLRRCLNEKLQDEIIVEEEKQHHAAMDENLIVKTSKSRGRYIVPKTDMDIGDVLGVEKPIASVLYEEYYDTRCYGCQKKFTSLLPCRSCAKIVYCSPECEEDAWNLYHKYECEYMDFLSYSWMSRIGLLALRVFMTIRCKHLDDVCNLIVHDNERQSDVLLQFTIVAKILEEICNLSSFVPEEERDKSGQLLLNLLKICQCNSYCISEMFGNSFRESKPKDIGVALYKKASFFNHSCNPDLDIIFQGSTAFFKAIRSIKAGKEVCLDYGYVYTTDSIQLRRAALASQYYFDCECQPCSENWPTFDYQESSVPTFKCPECDAILNINELADEKFATCSACKTSQDVVKNLGQLQDSHEKYASALTRAAYGDLKSALADMIQHLKLTEKLIAPPFKDYSSCQAAVKQCFRLMANDN